jgi:hypothetical protein
MSATVRFHFVRRKLRLERFSYSDGNRATFSSNCNVNSIVDVVLLIESKPQTGACRRQQLIRTKLIPSSCRCSNATECNQAEPFRKHKPVLTLCRKHATILKLSRRVTAQIAVESKQA